MAVLVWKRVSLVLLCATALLAPLAVAAFPGSPPELAQSELAVVAERIVQLTNQTRAQGGLPPLQPVAYLSDAASGHSKEMMELNYFAHISPTPGRAQPKMRIQLARGWDTRIGENIYRAQGITADALADRAVSAWIKSPSHYKNLMDPTFNSIGVGVAPKGDEFAVTQNFSNQTIVVKALAATPEAGGYAMVFQGQVREGSREGALFINNVFKQTFTADAQGRFELRASVPAGAQVSISQKKPGSSSYSQNLMFPIEAAANR
jgi:uncharacterized protein YkwD